MADREAQWGRGGNKQPRQAFHPESWVQVPPPPSDLSTQRINTLEVKSVNLKLNRLDAARVRVIQRHFQSLEPVGIDLSNVDVVRLALRETMTKLGISPHVAREEMHDRMTWEESMSSAPKFKAIDLKIE